MSLCAGFTTREVIHGYSRTLHLLVWTMFAASPGIGAAVTVDSETIAEVTEALPPMRTMHGSGPLRMRSRSAGRSARACWRWCWTSPGRVP